MSLTNAALSIGAKVIGHDEIVVGKELHDGIRSTETRGTLIIPPSTHGDGRTGPVVNDINGNVIQPEKVSNSAGLNEPVISSSANEKKQRGRKKASSAPSVVNVTGRMDGFGAINTTYGEFNVGQGCLRVELTEQSWIPPVAERIDGTLKGVFHFDQVQSRKYVNLGLEFEAAGKTNIVFIELPDA